MSKMVLDNEYLPTMDDLAKATDDLDMSLMDVPMDKKMTVQIAADEIFANIVRHSGASKWFLTVEISEDPKSVNLTFKDDGTPFDPLIKRDPDTTLSAEERSIGGVGIFIVKKTMSPVKYVCKDGYNILTMGLLLE